MRAWLGRSRRSGKLSFEGIGLLLVGLAVLDFGFIFLSFSVWFRWFPFPSPPLPSSPLLRLGR